VTAQPAGTFTYLYDGAQRMVSLTNPFAEVSSWAYQSNGWLLSQTLGNGAMATHSQNALGQLTSLINRTGGGAVLSQFDQMVHDGAGNRLSVTANVPGVAALTGGIGYGFDTKDQI
jgi:YD repeat-containing protein